MHFFLREFKAHNHRYSQTRSFAAVLFRRIATKTRKIQGAEESRELFIALQDAQKVAIREKLLQNLQSEGLSHVRHKVGDAVAEVARQYAENGGLPSFPSQSTEHVCLLLRCGQLRSRSSVTHTCKDCVCYLQTSRSRRLSYMLAKRKGKDSFI